MQEKIIEDSVRLYRNFIIKNIYDLSPDYIEDNTNLVLLGIPAPYTDLVFSYRKINEDDRVEFEQVINSKFKKSFETQFKIEGWQNYTNLPYKKNFSDDFDQLFHELFNSHGNHKTFKWFEQLMSFYSTYYLLDFNNKNYYIEYTDKRNNFLENLYFGEYCDYNADKEFFIKRKIII
mgnify:FL=1